MRKCRVRSQARFRDGGVRRPRPTFRKAGRAGALAIETITARQIARGTGRFGHDMKWPRPRCSRAHANAIQYSHRVTMPVQSRFACASFVECASAVAGWSLKVGAALRAALGCGINSNTMNDAGPSNSVRLGEAPLPSTIAIGPVIAPPHEVRRAHLSFRPTSHTFAADCLRARIRTRHLVHSTFTLTLPLTRRQPPLLDVLRPRLPL